MCISSNKQFPEPAVFWIISLGVAARINRMKIPWPQPFEDGDVRSFLEDFEDVAEVVGVKTERGKLVALRTLLKGRAKAVLDAAAKGPAKLEWVPAKEALLAGFDGVADRQGAMRRFKECRLCVGGDPLVYAVSLRQMLLRALPTLIKEAEDQLLIDQFFRWYAISSRKSTEDSTDQSFDATGGIGSC